MKIFAHTHTKKKRTTHHKNTALFFYYLCIESLGIPKNRKNQKKIQKFSKMSKSKGDEEENSWDPYKADKELGKQMDIARDIFLYVF